MTKITIKGEDQIIGQNIRTIRRLAGLTQTDLAKKLGISYQQMQKYEKASNRTSGSRLVQIARALGCTITDLFEDTMDATLPDREPTWYDSKQGLNHCQEMAKLPEHMRDRIMQLVRSINGGATDGA